MPAGLPVKMRMVPDYTNHKSNIIRFRSPYWSSSVASCSDEDSNVAKHLPLSSRRGRGGQACLRFGKNNVRGISGKKIYKTNLQASALQTYCISPLVLISPLRLFYCQCSLQDWVRLVLLRLWEQKLNLQLAIIPLFMLRLPLQLSNWQLPED